MNRKSSTGWVSPRARRSLVRCRPPVDAAPVGRRPGRPRLHRSSTVVRAAAPDQRRSAGAQPLRRPVSRCSRRASCISSARSGVVPVLAEQPAHPVQPLGHGVDVHLQRLGGPRRASRRRRSRPAAWRPGRCRGGRRTPAPAPRVDSTKPRDVAALAHEQAEEAQLRRRSRRSPAAAERHERAPRSAPPRCRRRPRAPAPRTGPAPPAVTGSAPASRQLPAHRGGRGGRARRSGRQSTTAPSCSAGQAAARGGQVGGRRRAPGRAPARRPGPPRRRAAGPGRRPAAGRARAAPRGRGPGR